MKDGVLQVKDLLHIGFTFKFTETLFFGDDGEIHGHNGFAHISRCVYDLDKHIMKRDSKDNVLDYFVVEICGDTLKVSPTVKYKDIMIREKERELRSLKKQKEMLDKDIKETEKELEDYQYGKDNR